MNLVDLPKTITRKSGVPVEIGPVRKLFCQLKLILMKKEPEKIQLSKPLLISELSNPIATGKIERIFALVYLKS